jgi:hypothetical protein
MGNCGINKNFVHLLECAALGLRVKEYVAEARGEIREEEEREIVKADVAQDDRTALSEEEIQVLRRY